jgi:N-methylhydantoinase A
VADAVDIRRVIVPPNPGLCSAFGAAIAPLRVDRVWSLGSRSDSVVEAELRQQIESVEREVVVELEADGLDGQPLVRRFIACRYYLQNHEEDILIDDLRDGFIARLCDNFHRRFRAAYGYAFDGEPIELVHAKVEGTERAMSTLSPPPMFYGTTAIEQIGTRPVVVGDGLVSDVPVFRRGVLTNSVIGPAVIEEPDSTTYLPGGWHAQGASGNCIVATRLSGR